MLTSDITGGSVLASLLKRKRENGPAGTLKVLLRYLKASRAYETKDKK